MSEAATVDGPGGVTYGDGPGEVCPRRQGPDEGRPPGAPVRAGLVPAPEAAPLRPWYRILVTVTPLGFETPQPVSHFTAQKFRTIEAVDIEAAHLYELDYLPMREVMGTVAVVEMRPGQTPIVVNARHFPEV